MVNAAMGIFFLRYVMTWGKMEGQEDPRRHSKEVCTSASRIKGRKRIKKVASALNTRIHGGSTLRQLVRWQRRISMPIMLKPSLVPYGENVPPFGARPICMPNPPKDCSGFYMSIGWGTIFFVPILPPEKFLLWLWAC